jgi:peptide/nickel transport system permease protein
MTRILEISVGAYIVRRLIQAVFIVIIVTALVFVVMRMMPGDPILFYLSQDELYSFSQEQILQLRHDYGLDKPIIFQYTDWVGKTIRGDLGYSLTSRKPVTTLIASTLPVTLYLGFISFIIGNVIGITAGMVTAVRRGKALDTVVTTLANIGNTIHTFWLAILMIYLFAMKLGWVPTHGFVWPTVDFWLSIKMSIMPVICLCIYSIGGMARQTRSVMLEVVRQDYVRTAWSKGLTERAVIVKHVMKNGFIPLFTLLGMGVPAILGGSVIIEQVFNISGMGRLMVNAIFSLDYAVVEAIVLISALMIVFSNLIVDVSYGWLDPRVSYS